MSVNMLGRLESAYSQYFRHAREPFDPPCPLEAHQRRRPSHGRGLTSDISLSPVSQSHVRHVTEAWHSSRAHPRRGSSKPS